MASADLNDLPLPQAPRRLGGRIAARARRNAAHIAIWLAWAAGVAAVGVLAVDAGRSLGDPAVITGYSLFGAMVVLALFNVRKKLSMVPLVRARWWTTLHVSGGVAAYALYVLHAGVGWPAGGYEQALLLLFYGATASGILGWFLERVMPARLTQTGIEVIFERIPGELARVRQEAEDLMVRSAAETGSDTLARVYLETFDWFFRRPRFVFNHVWGGRKGSAWIFRSADTARRYMNEDERRFLDQLQHLALLKNRLDFHYVAQGLTKLWLLLHVPLAVAVLALATWHLVLVNAYAL